MQLATGSATPPAAHIESWARAALRQAGSPDAEADGAELCVRVVDGPESQRLNHQFRGKDAPTNVLSFPADPGPAAVPGLHPLGDVVVCAPVVAQEAGDQGKAYHDHFAHMVVHGVLHLLGYDHVSAGEAERMERLEIAILGSFGVSDPYGEG